MKFADYFGRSLSQVSSAHFPWVKTFKESPLSKLIDVSTISLFIFVILNLSQRFSFRNGVAMGM
jgi:hypothetical protein